jgi:hypothetical protein
MKETEISLPSNPDFSEMTRIIEKTVVANELQITLKTTLGMYPGSTHWHIKNGKHKGILEITLWPERTRAWFSIQDGRRGDGSNEKSPCSDGSLDTHC